MITNKDLIEKMKRAPILVGIKKKKFSSKMKESDFNDEDNDNCYLTTASEIFVNDELIYQRVFNPLTAPKNQYLEEFYKVL